jgi:hypothetical protein
VIPRTHGQLVVDAYKEPQASDRDRLDMTLGQTRLTIPVNSLSSVCHRRRPLHYSQPPVNPARRSPVTKYGLRRVMSQIMPVR